MPAHLTRTIGIIRLDEIDAHQGSMEPGNLSSALRWLVGEQNATTRPRHLRAEPAPSLDELPPISADLPLIRSELNCEFQQLTA